MKDKILLLSFREIKKSFKRFLSLLIMSFLGVAVFVGLANAKDALLLTLDKYYDDNNMYDIKVISTLGLTNEDVNELKELDLVEEAYGVYSKDVYYISEDKTYVVKVIGINDNINKVVLKEGRLPEKKDEILVEEYLAILKKKKIGDYITINDPDENIKNKEFKIVGTIKSPLYLLAGSPAMLRGATTIGTGQVNFYTYAKEEAFDMEYFTEIYLKIKGSTELVTGKEEYDKLIEYGLGEVNAIKKYREKARYDEIYNRVMNEILEEERKGQEKINQESKKLQYYKDELDNGLNKLKQNKQKIENGKKELNNSLIELNKAKKQLDNGYSKIDKAKKELAKAKKEIQDSLDKYNLTIDDVITIYNFLNGKEVTRESFKNLVKEDTPCKESIYKVIDYLYDNNCFEKINKFFSEGLEKTKKEIINLIPEDFENYDEVVKFINDISIDSIRNCIYKNILDTDKVEELKKYIPKTCCKYDEIINFLDNYSSNVKKIKLLFNTIFKLKNAEKEIKNNEKELYKRNKEYNDAYKKYLAYKRQLSDGEKELNNGYKKYYANLNNYNLGVIKFNAQKIEFERKIEEAKEDINSLEMPTWYVSTRSDNNDYSSYLGISGSIDNLAKAFPTIFYIVAIFMSIMSMSRMALEDRQEIGSLKALGFSNFHIMKKYLIYSSLATLIGSILGGLFGFYYLTYFIWKMYGILYVTTDLQYYYNFVPLIVGVLVAFICITITTIITIRSIIKENTSSLLRPKAPLNGQKIILEKIPLWNKINFSNKITIRNIIRYKKRVIMTIIGIIGCTVLLITGYGIRDSIVNIPIKQYDEVTVCDDLVYYIDGFNTDNEVFKSDKITGMVKGELVQSYVGPSNVNLIAFEEPDKIDSIIKLKSSVSDDLVKLEDNKVYISYKLADINNYKIGDIVTVTINNEQYSLVIDDIFDNYIGNYLVMSKKTYEKKIKSYKGNIIYLKFTDKEAEAEIISELTKDDYLFGLVNSEYTKYTVDNMLKSLDNVVLLLIVFSGMLSFVVLYNLSYINISERKREIASLKVLGFYNYEVDNYIIKENIIITLVGILLGLAIGKPFVDFIVSSLELDLLKFIHEIDFSSYVKTFLFMTGFTVIVSIIIHFTLKRINMTESLKSVE